MPTGNPHQPRPARRLLSGTLIRRIHDRLHRAHGPVWLGNLGTINSRLGAIRRLRLDHGLTIVACGRNIYRLVREHAPPRV